MMIWALATKTQRENNEQYQRPGQTKVLDAATPDVH